MKKIIFSLFFIFMILCLSGCWNYKELNNYSIVSGIAIDKKDDKFEVSVLISNSPKNNSDSTSSESKVVVFSGEGESIFEAFKDIGLISPKELYLSGFSVLVISDEVAEDGINKAIDFFLRYSSSRNDFYVVVAKDTKAKNTLKIMTSITNFPSQNISDNIKSTDNLQGIVKAINFDDLTSMLISDGIDPTINSINVFGDVEEGSSTENLESTEPETYVKIGTLAIFKGDKLVDFGTKTESVGINLINGNVSEMYLKVDYKDGYVVIDTINLSSKIKTNVKNKKPIVDIDIAGEAKIIEVSGNIDLESNQVIEELEKRAGSTIKKYAKDAIDVAKENKADIFGIGLKFYKNHPKYYNTVKNNWDNTFNTIDFNIKSKLVLKNKVSSKNSLEETHDRQKN